MALWTGQFERVLDEKKRFLLPKVFRELIAENQVYFTPGTQHCLELHTEASLGEQVNRLRQRTTNEKATRLFTRLYYSQSQACLIDGQGRIRLPQSLALWADLTREITIVGTGLFLEIWNSNRWNDFLGSYQDDFDQLAEQAFELSGTEPNKQGNSLEKNDSFKEPQAAVAQDRPMIDSSAPDSATGSATGSAPGPTTDSVLPSSSQRNHPK